MVLVNASARKLRWFVAVVTLAMLAATFPLQVGMAAPGTLPWMGQDWTISANAMAQVDGNGYAVITRTSGTADASLHVNRILPTDGDGSSLINQNGTPWVEVTWEDNAMYRGVDVFIDDEGHPNNPRVQFGSLFNCEGIAYTKYDAVEEKTVLAGAGCDVPGDPGSRVSGDVHTMYVGKRADGTIDYRFDGVWYTSTLLRDAGITDFEFGDVHLRLRSDSGTTAVFRSFEYGDDHSLAGAIAGDLPGLVDSTPIGGPAATARKVHRNLMALATGIEAAASNNMAGFACLQTWLFDLQDRSQVNARRITPANAAPLYAKTAEIRTAMGCGGIF